MDDLRLPACCVMDAFNFTFDITLPLRTTSYVVTAMPSAPLYGF